MLIWFLVILLLIYNTCNRRRIWRIHRNPLIRNWWMWRLCLRKDWLLSENREWTWRKVLRRLWDDSDGPSHLKSKKKMSNHCGTYTFLGVFKSNKSKFCTINYVNDSLSMSKFDYLIRIKGQSNKTQTLFLYYKKKPVYYFHNSCCTQGV